MLPTFSAVKGGVEYSIPVDYSKLNENDTEKIARVYFFNAEKLKDGIINEDMTNALMLYSVLQQINPDKIEYPIKLGILYDKIKNIGIKTLIADAGYKIPAIAKMLIDDGIEPLFPYKRPQTKEGFFKKYEYAYDEYYDCYICPNGKTLEYSTTNREGYREYKSCSFTCEGCPYLSQCTNSKEHVKSLRVTYGKIIWKYAKIFDAK